MNLRMKLLLPIILLMILMSGVSGYFSYQESAKSLRSALMDNMEGEAKALVRAADEMTKGARADIRRVAVRQDVTGFYATDIHNKENGLTFSDSLEQIRQTYPDFERLSLMDDKGVIVASSDKSTIGRDFKDRNYFQAAIRGEVFLAPPFKSSVTNKGVMAVAAPITLNGKIVGASYCILSLEGLYAQSVAPVKIGAHGHAFLLGPDGLIAAHKNAEWVFNNSLPSVPYYKKMAGADQEGVLDFIGNTGAHVFNYHAKSVDSKLTAVVQAEYDDVFSGLSDMRTMSVIVAVVAVIVAAVLLILLLQPMLRDINAGMAFAGRIAAGDLSGSLKVSRKDELGKLADALRSIPESLKQIIAEYKTLEHNVEGGRLGAEGDAARFSGDFATLIQGTNAVLARFRQVLNAIPSPVVVLDKDAKAVFLNSKAQEIAGTDYAGKTCGELFTREDFMTESCGLRKALATLRPASSETVAHPGGKTMDVSYTAIPMLDGNGKLSAVLQLVIDLTQIKNTQRTILEVAAQAQAISDRVAAASEQLSAQVGQVVKGTEVQRDRVGSTVTAMEEMNVTVMEVARSAGQASEQADGTRAKANEGAELVNRVIGAIRQVNQVATELQSDMQELGGQAEAIGGVMNVISDIADQTNLLALNAAIEAARAGEAGRGFAVVADEVRKLAEKTMSATTEVGSSIRGIQSSAGNNIRRVGEAAKSVAEATELAGTSGEALQQIVGLASQNAAIISGIATAAEEQSATSEEINRSIDEINRIAAETSAGMHQSGEAVQELARMSHELKVLLEKLRA